MLRVAVPVLLSLLVALPASTLEDPSSSLPGVEDLTPENFAKLVTGKKHALVEFYAPWCGHCKKMTPEYKKLGEMVAADPKLKSMVILGKVNADEHRTLGTKFGVSGFPTIKYFPRGKATSEPESYSGARTADAFLQFLKKKIEEDKTFARVEELDTLVKTLVNSDGLDALLKQIKEKVSKLEGDELEKGELYMKIVQKALDKGGVEYFSKEHARLTKMLDTGNVSPQKASEMSRKVSVLSAFLPSEEEQ